MFVEVNNKEELEEFYKSVVPKIREVARSHGYAIGVHGSMRRDLDLIAVPWSHSFSDKRILAEEIQKVCCGHSMIQYDWEQKPNGRSATCFPICFPNHEAMKTELSLGHADLSVVGASIKEIL